jgi:hypothetical protein
MIRALANTLKFDTTTFNLRKPNPNVRRDLEKEGREFGAIAIF